MAQFEPAFQFVLDHEDPKREGLITRDASREHPDAVQRFGLNSGAHPELKEAGYFAFAPDAHPRMPNEVALPLAAEAYKHAYWEKIGGYQINDQQVANKIMDFAVNTGVGAAGKIVQRSCNQCLADVLGFVPLSVDGVIGLQTIEAVNKINPADLLPVLKSTACRYYQIVAAQNPQEAKNLNGWLHRANL